MKISFELSSEPFLFLCTFKLTDLKILYCNLIIFAQPQNRNGSIGLPYTDNFKKSTERL